MTLMSGKLGAKGKLELERGSGRCTASPATRAPSSVAKLRTIDNALEEDFIRWDQLAATGIEYDGAHNRDSSSRRLPRAGLTRA